MHRMWEQYDPDGETGMAIIAEIQTLVKRLYEQYGTDGTDDETLIADLEALMHELWQKYGPGSDINKDFTVAWRDLLTKYGVDSAAVEDFSDEMNAILEAMWEKYGPGGESRDAMLAEIKSLLGAIGASIGEGDIGQWISTLFITESQPASNSAPVKAANMSRSIVSRLSNAAGLQPNDVDASVTVITKQPQADLRGLRGWRGRTLLRQSALLRPVDRQPHDPDNIYAPEHPVDDPSAHSRARVEVKVVGREDCALVNNEFTVYLGGKTVWIPMITVVYRCIWL